MVDDLFAEAFVHRRAPFLARLRGYSAHKICGMRLRPFSRWHAANLDFIGSPLVGNKGTADFSVLWLAAQCCQLKFPQQLPLRSNRWIRLRRLLAYRRYARAVLRGESPYKTWRDYMGDYSTRPEFVFGENSSAVRCPWYSYEVASLLQRDRTLTKAQAWDMPVGEGSWWLAAHAEAAGEKVDFITPEDREQLEELGID